MQHVFCYVIMEMNLWEEFSMKFAADECSSYGNLMKEFSLTSRRLHLKHGPLPPSATLALFPFM